MPTVYAPPCVPLVPKPERTTAAPPANGVTGTAVNVVYYQMQPGGLTSVIQGAAGTPAQGLATVQAYVAMFNRIFEMYGRHVNLIPFTASGADSDPVAAHADAITVAEQDHAFASINGPGETNAYEVELARLHVLCMACGDSATYGQITQDAPYQWANLPTADTSLFETVDYVAVQAQRQGRRLGRRPEDAHAQAQVHRRQRDLRTARTGHGRADPGAHQETGGRPRRAWPLRPR